MPSTARCGLCPSCEAVHVEVARNLWQLGLRPQALLEWRTAVDLQPRLFSPALGELFASGAKAAGAGRRRLLQQRPTCWSWCHSWPGARRIADAFVVLDQADALGRAARREPDWRGRGCSSSGRQPAAAAATAAAARRLGIQDPRLAVLQARLTSCDQRGVRRRRRGAGNPGRRRHAHADATWRSRGARRARGHRLQEMEGRRTIAGGTETGALQSRGDRPTGGPHRGRPHRRRARPLDQLLWASTGSRSRITPNDVALWIEFARAADVGRPRDETAREALRPGGPPEPEQPGNHRRPAGAGASAWRGCGRTRD